MKTYSTEEMAVRNQNLKNEYAEAHTLRARFILEGTALAEINKAAYLSRLGAKISKHDLSKIRLAAQEILAHVDEMEARS
jgi:hypothetical protein